MRSEFEFIQNIKNKYGLSRVGDDCAVIPRDAEHDTIVTADLLVEDIDFRLSWTTPEVLGHKVLAVSLSDIASMGGTPEWSLLSIGVPEKLWKGDFVDRLYEGWHQIADRFDVELIGGDVSRSPDKLVLDSVVGGRVGKGNAILRSGARAGDSIFVSGPLGGAAGGLRLLEKDRVRASTASESEMVDRQLRPLPRIELGRDLRGIASAMIDISDGLSSDVAHICEASKVGAIITNVPIDPNLTANFDDDTAFDFAMNGGEDFELLFTVPHELLSEAERLSTIRVGVITPEAGKIELIRGEVKTDLTPKGFRHF